LEWAQQWILAATQAKGEFITENASHIQAIFHGNHARSSFILHYNAHNARYRWPIGHPLLDKTMLIISMPDISKPDSIASSGREKCILSSWLLD